MISPPLLLGIYKIWDISRYFYTLLLAQTEISIFVQFKMVHLRQPKWWKQSQFLSFFYKTEHLFLFLSNTKCLANTGLSTYAKPAANIILRSSPCICDSADPSISTVVFVTPSYAQIDSVLRSGNLWFWYGTTCKYRKSRHSLLIALHFSKYGAEASHCLKL